MNYGTGLASAGQSANSSNLSNLPKEVEIGLLESVQGTLSIAHERVSRLEGLADRIFGEHVGNASIAPVPVPIGDNLIVTARNLVERLNEVMARLERVA